MKLMSYRESVNHYRHAVDIEAQQRLQLAISNLKFCAEVTVWWSHIPGFLAIELTPTATWLRLNFHKGILDISSTTELRGLCSSRVSAHVPVSQEHFD